MGTDAEKYLHMGDMDVDDDEWQLAAWYFEDQKKERPLAILDYHQELFGTSGTFRAQHRDHGFLIFSRNNFESMFGDMPEEPFEFEELKACPYEYDPKSQSWTSRLTGASPLVLHLAGNDWLCGCQIFQAEGYENITPKFRENCEKADSWLNRVEEGIQSIALTEDPLEQIFVLNDRKKSQLKARDGEIDEAVLKRYHLDDAAVHRMLQDDPYKPEDDTPLTIFEIGLNIILFPVRLLIGLWNIILSLFGIGSDATS